VKASHVAQAFVALAQSERTTGHVMTVDGGNVEVSEDELLEMERNCFVDLVKTEATLDRFEHMLTKGKPLRN
jgi:hypothetical protein